MKTRWMNLIVVIACATIIIAKVLNWVIGFNESTHDLINKAMFILIGVSYLIFGYALDQFRYRLITMVCELILITMNFFSENNYLNILGIISILVPMLIGRLVVSKNNENSVPE
ncbi:MAG: hypothetical protein ACK5RI_05295 [Bacteroidota bacterium]